MTYSLAGFIMRSKARRQAKAASPSFFRCGGRLDSGFGGDDGGGGSVNSIDAVVVEACHGGIWRETR